MTNRDEQKYLSSLVGKEVRIYMPNSGNTCYQGILLWIDLTNRSALLRNKGSDNSTRGGRDIYYCSEVLISGFELIAKTKEWEELTPEEQRWNRQLENIFYKSHIYLCSCI
jgi:hypothetical protein